MVFIPSHFDDPIMVSFTGDNFPLSYNIIHNLIRAGDRQEAVYKDLVGTFGVLFNKGLFISVLYCCVFCLSPLPLCSLGSYCLSRRSEERVNSHFFLFLFSFPWMWGWGDCYCCPLLSYWLDLDTVGWAGGGRFASAWCTTPYTTFPSSTSLLLLPTNTTTRRQHSRDQREGGAQHLVPPPPPPSPCPSSPCTPPPPLSSYVCTWS